MSKNNYTPSSLSSWLKKVKYWLNICNEQKNVFIFKKRMKVIQTFFYYLNEIKSISLCFFCKIRGEKKNFSFVNIFFFCALWAWFAYEKCALIFQYFEITYEWTSRFSCLILISIFVSIESSFPSPKVHKNTAYILVLLEDWYSRLFYFHCDIVKYFLHMIFVIKNDVYKPELCTCCDYWSDHKVYIPLKI